MTNRQTALPLFDEPTLSDIYMSDMEEDDDDDLSDDSMASSAVEGAFPVQRMSQQNDSLLAELPAKSLSMIQTVPSPMKTTNRHHRSRRSRHSYRRQQPSPGEDPPGYEASSTLDLTRFIYTLPDVHEEEPSKASTMPKDPKLIDPYVQQRRLHLCVIFLTCMFLLLGITVAVIGSTIYQEEEVPTATSASAALEQEDGGSLPAVPIDLPDNLFSVRPPSLSPSRGDTTFPSALKDTIVPTAMPSLREVTRPVAPPSRRPTLRPTRTPTMQSTQSPSSPPPILELLEVQVSPPSRAPTRAPVTARPTPVRSFAPTPRRVEWTPAPVEETFEPTVPAKKPKGEKRQ
jgi:hypothetical protein